MKIPKLPIGAAKTESVEDGLRQEVDSLKQVIEELTVDFQDVSTSLENEENDKVRLEATLTEAREKFARLDSEKDRLEEQLSELNAGMAYQADLTRGESLNELDNVEADLKMVKKKLAKKDAEAGKLFKQLTSAKKEISSLLILHHHKNSQVQAC